MIMNKMPVSLACDLQLSAYMVIRSMRAITLEASTEIDFFVLKGCVSDRVYGTYIPRAKVARFATWVQSMDFTR